MMMMMRESLTKVHMHNQIPPVSLTTPPALNLSDLTAAGNSRLHGAPLSSSWDVCRILQEKVKQTIYEIDQAIQLPASILYKRVSCAATGRRPPLPPPHPPRPPAGQPAKPGKRESYRSLISQSGPPATVRPPLCRPSVGTHSAETFFDNLTIFEAPTKQSRVAPSPAPPAGHHFGALRTNKQTDKRL